MPIGSTVWMTGLPASGKSTLALAVQALLLDRGVHAHVLDGDDLRHGVSADLGFGREDRDEHVRRVGEIALLLAAQDATAIVALVSPFRAARDRVRERHHNSGAGFVEVHLAAGVALCAERDPKGLYARQRRGALSGLTGVDAPYEPPLAPELVVPGEMALDVAAAIVIAELTRDGRSGPKAVPS